eukprot:gene5085-6189_t
MATEILKLGYNGLFMSLDVVLVQDPFKFLYRDSDVEAMSYGWDDRSAYGYDHAVEDKAMGWSAWAHGTRVSWLDPGFMFVQATEESVRMMQRIASRLGHPDDVRNTTSAHCTTRPLAWRLYPGHEDLKGYLDQYGVPTPSAAAGPAYASRLFNEELLPSYGHFHGSGVIYRSMNYLCFANSRTLFTRIRHEPEVRKHQVAVHVNYHPETLERAKSIDEAYSTGNWGAMNKWNTGPGLHEERVHTDCQALKKDGVGMSRAAKLQGSWRTGNCPPQTEKANGLQLKAVLTF